MIRYLFVSLFLAIQVIAARESDQDPQILWSQKLYFSVFPQELKEHIFSYLNYSDLSNACLVKKEWFSLSVRQYQNLSHGHYRFTLSNVREFHPWYIIKQYCQNVQFDQLSAPVIQELLKKMHPMKHLTILSFDRSLSLQDVEEKSEDSGISQYDHDLNALAPFNNLSLMAHHISNEDLDKIAPCLKTLEQLYLTGNKISHPGIKILCQHLGVSLKILFLSHNPLGNDGIRELASFIPSLPQLQHLDVSATQIGSKGLMELLDNLPKSLKVLNLSNCNISEGGIHPKDITQNLLNQNDSLAKFLTLYERIPLLKNLEELNLSSNNLTFMSLYILNIAIKEHQPQWQTLDLSFNMDIDSHSIDLLTRMIKSLPNLQKLYLGFCSLSTEDVMKLQNVKNGLSVILDTFPVN